MTSRRKREKKNKMKRKRFICNAFYIAIMACYLAPEKPWLSSVISEVYFHRIHSASALPQVLPDRRTSRFGDDYQREFCAHLGRHAEINPDHRFCWIGDEEQWPNVVQEKLFLNNRIDFIHCDSERGEKAFLLLLLRDDRFADLQDQIKRSLPQSTYDGIILFQCLEKIYKNSLSLIHQCRRALTGQGQLIIVHRDVHNQTLPLPSEVLPSWALKSSNLLGKLLEHLQRDRRAQVDSFQQIRTIKFTMKKSDWFSLLYHRTFFPLNLIEQKKVVDGLRRLNETFFKYQPGTVELHDRLVFLSLPNQSEPFDQLPRYLRESRTATSVRSRITMNNSEVFRELSRLNQPLIKPNLFVSTLRLI